MFGKITMKHLCFKQVANNAIIIGVYFFLVLFEVCHSIGCTESSAIYDAGLLVKTNSGYVVGKYVKVFNTNVTAFLGIPYAKPPIGEKRFAKPEPIGKWDSTIFAYKNPPSCMQFSSRDYEFIPKDLNKNEDCLFLNIWSPICHSCNPFNKLPVVVWIHGGAFAFGSSAMDIYNGSILASYGNVIVVSLNYRLGVFGFLNAGINGASGNAGLFDQLLALKWISANIQSFGGDPNSITLIGWSAGAISINDLLVSPLSKGLFHKVIMKSGSAYNPQFTDDLKASVEKARAFSKIIGCEVDNKTISSDALDIVRCLKGKTALELAKTEDIFTSKSALYFQPIFGDEFLPEPPRLAIKSGKFLQLPTLIGTNKDDATMFVNYLMPDVFPRNETVNLTLLQAKDLLNKLFSSIAPGLSSKVILDFYFRNITEDNLEDMVKAITNAIGDFCFHCPGLYLAEKANESRLYWFNYRSLKNADAEWMGVSHFGEIPFIFGKPIIDSNSYTLEDKIFSEDLIQKWTNFARTGKPLAASSTHVWPKLSPSNPIAYDLSLRDEGSVPYPRLKACEFWRTYFSEWTS